MSDEGQWAPMDMGPSLNEVRQTIERRVAHRECPMCGHTETAHLPGTAGVVLLLGAIKGPFEWTPVGPPIACVPFVCEHCGYLRLHLPMDEHGPTSLGDPDAET